MEGHLDLALMVHTVQPEAPSDPREQEDWFLRLPDKAKDEFRERFRQAERSPIGALQHRERLIQCFIDASIVYLPAELLFFGFSFWSFLVIAGVVVIRMLCGYSSAYFVVLSAMASVGIAMATTLTREAGRAL